MQRIQVGTREAFDKVQLFGVRLSAYIDPCAFVKTHGVDDQCIAVPSANRMTHPGEVQRVPLRM